MSDYANEDVDSLRAIAEYCGGTEHGVFLAGLADRMEQVIVEAQPVFTREDVEVCRDRARAVETQSNARETTLTSVFVPWRDLADRIERTLPNGVLESA